MFNILTIDILRDRFDLEMPLHRRRNADISVYREFVARHDQLISVPETAKSNELAASHRNVGNRAYLEKKFNMALVAFNQSICCAEPESEHLGMGYANRSAVYCEMGEYEFALYNIDLARKHNYPERLMPKLMARETHCRKRIEDGHSKGTVAHPMVGFNVDVNEKIPFLAKGIGMKQYEKMGRGLVAERDFNAGDVILDEKIDLCFVSFGRSYSNCCHCGSSFLSSLIPCPGCVAVMYCSEDCREEDQRMAHRFECSVVTKLWCVTYTNMLIMARLFFYGLTAFNDDITEMMKFCLPNAATGSKPLKLDFTNPNALDVFKVLHKAKLDRDPTLDHFLKLSAAAFHHVFMKNPLVQSIFRTDAQRNFLLRCMLIHGRVSTSLVHNRENKYGGWLCVMPPVATLCNHSCDPNAISVIDFGRMKLVVLRPIEKGAQIVISYGPTWWSENYRGKCSFECKCVVCDHGPGGTMWHSAREKQRLITMETIRDMFQTDGEAPEFLKFQRMVQVLARDGHHPGKPFAEAIKVYDDKLADAVMDENAKLNRAKLMANLI